MSTTTSQITSKGKVFTEFKVAVQGILPKDREREILADLKKVLLGQPVPVRKKVEHQIKLDLTGGESGGKSQVTAGISYSITFK